MPLIGFIAATLANRCRLIRRGVLLLSNLFLAAPSQYENISDLSDISSPAKIKTRGRTGIIGKGCAPSFTYSFRLLGLMHRQILSLL
jgi:hypothetical protein